MLNDPSVTALEGGCDCRRVRYRLESPPLFVHCCHCRWCQRETGSSFAHNAMIEADRVTPLGERPELVATPSASGRGQRIARCPSCRIALWSHYAGAGPVVSFVRVGTLDDPDRWPPDIHIFTASKQPWVVIPPGVPAVAGYYDREQYWPAASLERWRALTPRIDAYRASLPLPGESATDRLARTFRARTLPKEEWTHEAHLHVGLWHLLHFSAEEALVQLRDGICSYNEATGGENTDSSGYHETITRFYVWAITRFLAGADRSRPVDELAAQVVHALGARDLPFRYWSRERLFSVEARRGWARPDLEQLDPPA